MKIKRLITVLIISCFLLNSTAVLAAGPEKGSGEMNNNSVQNNSVQNGEGFQQKSQFERKWDNELKSLRNEILRCNVAAVHLRNEIRKTQREVLSRIEQLKEQKESLTEEQIQELKDYLQSLRENNNQVRNEMGTIQREVNALRTAKREQNGETVQQCLERILLQQQERIRLMDKTAEDLEKIL